MIPVILLHDDGDGSNGTVRNYALREPSKAQLTSLFARDVHVNRVYVVSPGPDLLLYLDA